MLTALKVKCADWRTTIRPGDRIKIVHMGGEPQYDGAEGVVEFIDNLPQLHSTWGGLAVNPEIDQIIVMRGAY